MTAGPGATADPSELELVVTRTFDARRELVVGLWIGRNILRTWEVPRGLNQLVRGTRGVKAISVLWSGSGPLAASEAKRI
jgi:hypothetical protein